MDENDTSPPETGGWKLIDNGPFEDIVGPFYHSAELSSDDEPYRIGFRVARKHLNPNGALHGGMMATFLDLALGHTVHAATGVPGPTMVLSIDYLTAGLVGDWIESRSRIIHSSYKSGYVDTIAMGPRGPVARANGLWRLMRPKE